MNRETWLKNYLLLLNHVIKLSKKSVKALCQIKIDADSNRASLMSVLRKHNLYHGFLQHIKEENMAKNLFSL